MESLENLKRRIGNEQGVERLERVHPPSFDMSLNDSNRKLVTVGGGGGFVVQTGAPLHQYDKRKQKNGGCFSFLGSWKKFAVSSVFGKKTPTKTPGLGVTNDLEDDATMNEKYDEVRVDSVALGLDKALDLDLGLDGTASVDRSSFKDLNSVKDSICGDELVLTLPSPPTNVPENKANKRASGRRDSCGNKEEDINVCIL